MANGNPVKSLIVAEPGRVKVPRLAFDCGMWKDRDRHVTIRGPLYQLDFHLAGRLTHARRITYWHVSDLV